MISVKTMVLSILAASGIAGTLSGTGMYFLGKHGAEAKIREAEGKANEANKKIAEILKGNVLEHYSEEDQLEDLDNINLDNIDLVDIDELEKSMQSVQNELQEKLKIISQQEKDIAAKDIKIQQLSDEIERLSRTTMCSGTHDIEGLERKIKDLEESIEQNDCAHSDELESLDDKIHNLNIELQSKIGEIGNLKAELQSKIDEICKLGDEHKNEVNSLKLKAAKHLNKGKEIKILADKLLEKAKEKDNIIAELKVKLQAAEEKAKSDSEEIQKLKCRLEIKKGLDEVDKGLSELDDTLSILKTETEAGELELPDVEPWTFGANK